MNRLFVTVALLASVASSAQAISGTLSLQFSGVNSFGVPTTHVELRLMCSLVCTPSAPTLHYRVATGTDAFFLEAPTEKVGFFSSGFGSNDTGVNVIDTEMFPSGVAFRTVAKGASCHCGNAIGQGGFVDITAPMTVIPPYATVGVSKAKVGFEWSQSISARPKGTETVTVQFAGAGVDTTKTMTPADFTSSGSGITTVTPTAPGTMTVTAKLMPYGATYTTTVTVDPSSGGAAGGGSGGAGGGGDAGGGQADEELGCSAAPFGLLLPLSLLSLRRRARRTRSDPT